MIKTVIFDIGNVILHFDLDEILEKYSDNEEERLFIKKNVYNSPEWTGLGLIDIGYITLEEAASQIKDRTNHENDPVVDDFLSSYMDIAYVDERVIDLIYRLKENGYKVYILSNISKQITERLNMNQVFKDIDGYILSYEYHQIKPYKSIYETLINKYNINPKEALFVDDRKDNIDTANSLGINGHNVEKNNYESILNLLLDYNVVR